MKSISIVTPCFNEEENVREVYERVRAVMSAVGRYRYLQRPNRVSPQGDCRGRP